MLGFQRAVQAFTECRLVMHIAYIFLSFLFSSFGGCFDGEFSLAGVKCLGHELSLSECQAEAASSKCEGGAGPGGRRGVGVRCKE